MTNATKTRRKLTPERLEHTITQLYLQDGNPHTADELAAHLNLSIATVRRVLQDCGGAPAGCTAQHFTAWGRTVSVFAPSSKHLRALVVKMDALVRKMDSQLTALDDRVDELQTQLAGTGPGGVERNSLP
mgnify:CR=1 FL=1